MLKVLLFALLAITLTNSLLVPHIGKVVASKPQTHRIDLKVPAYYRWSDITPTYVGPLRKFISSVVDLLPLSETFYESFGIFLESKPQYHEYLEEIKGIANDASVSWQKLAVTNFTYELSTVVELPACSSILALNSQNQIVHGRNLDFWPWQLMSKDSLRVKIYRGDTYLATIDTIFGAVFGLSGISAKGFSITVDTRYWHDGFNKLIDNFMINGYVPSAFLVRQTLQNANNFTEARTTLSTTNVTAPIYYTVAGLSTGCIIEKQPVGYRAIWDLTPESKNYFLVVTNYDAEDGDPVADDRKTPATKRLVALGQNNINPDSLFNIMKQYPTLNIASIYTTIYVPSTQYSDLTLWYGNIDDFDNNEESNISFLAKKTKKFDSDVDIEDPYFEYVVNSQYPSKEEQIQMADYLEQRLQEANSESQVKQINY